MVEMTYCNDVAHAQVADLLKKALLTDAQAQRFISMSGIASVADFVDTTRGELIEELMRTLEVPKFSAAATATKILRVSSARMMIALPAAAAKKPPIGQQSTWDRLASPPARWAVADAAKSADKAKAELIASGGTHRTRSAPPCLPIGGASCGYWYTVHRGGGAPDATQRVAAPMFPTAKIEEECTATYSSVEATVARRREASSSESDANVRRLAAVVKQAHKAAAVREALERAKRADERRRAQFARDVERVRLQAPFAEGTRRERSTAQLQQALQRVARWEAEHAAHRDADPDHRARLASRTARLERLEWDHRGHLITAAMRRRQAREERRQDRCIAQLEGEYCYPFLTAFETEQAEQRELRTWPTWDATTGRRRHSVSVERKEWAAANFRRWPLLLHSCPPVRVPILSHGLSFTSTHHISHDTSFPYLILICQSATPIGPIDYFQCCACTDLSSEYCCTPDSPTHVNNCRGQSSFYDTSCY